MKPVHLVIRDLEVASLKGELSPTFLDEYAWRNGEKVTALYALAARNALPVAVEQGRNDHVEKSWESRVDESAVERALDAESERNMRRLREAREDDRPAALRRQTRNALYPIKRGG
ncbi:hypothetical protein [Kineococcus rubinsiae]|uniref:hypothetical protein n=1 Tax=Kineococcus rubinsiae TaxID=2609562 RepID=UPI00143076A3|nr:hypothetical protein [Kineococcus rubinsiae]NIZ90855.1 hypothetical protein [Kineococcus rubinsiae]